jgi:hypothetical protein
MADTKTSDEVAAAALDGTELIRIVQGGANKKATPAQLATFVSFNTIVKGVTQNRRHGGATNATNLGTGAATINVYRAFPVNIRQAVTVDLLGIEITTGTTGKMRVLIHSDLNGYPGALLAESGELTVVAPAVYEGFAGGGNITLAPGLYWFVLWTDTANTARAITVAGINPAAGHLAAGGSAVFGLGWSQALAYSSGAAPNPYPAGSTIFTTATPAPNLFYRAL